MNAKGGGGGFLLMSPIFPSLPFHVMSHHYHNSDGVPQQTTVTCFSVLKGGTRMKRLDLFKLNGNPAALIVKGSSNSCQII